MALGGLGLLSGIALRQGVRARYDRAVQVSGAKAVGSLLALLAKFGHVGIPFAGMLTSFGAAYLVSSLPGIRSLWLNSTIAPPDRSTNLPIEAWITNVEISLRQHVENRRDVTPQQKVS